MKPKRLTPILNVSDIQESFAWFEKLGWTEPQVVIRFWIISVVLALVGLATLKLR